MGLHARDAMLLVRAELCRRIEALDRRIAASGPIGAHEEALAIAALAGDYRLSAARRLAEGLAAAVGAGGRRVAVRPWLDALRDSVGCEALGDQPGDDAWVAAVMVRLAG